jgi:predicted ATPase
MLVGRELELQELDARLKAMRKGEGSILFIAGEAGLGKTSLVKHWWGTVQMKYRQLDLPAPLFAETACSVPVASTDVGQLEALQPFAGLMQSLGMSLARRTSETTSTRDLIRRLAPKWIELVPVIGDLTSAVIETYQALDERKKIQQEAEHGAANQQQVFQQYSNFLSQLAARGDIGGVVLLIDDMHWADTSSTNLLFHLSRQITTERVLILVTYRPDDVRSARGGEGHPIVTVRNEIFRYSAGAELELGTLSQSAIRSFLAQSFVGHLPDEVFEEWLLRISGGNPLFVTQFVKTLREDRHFDGRGRFIGKYDEIDVPPSIRAVVEERIRRLDPTSHEMLRYASAEGEEFSSHLLGKITERKPLELLAELRKAEQTGVILKRGSARTAAGSSTTIYGFAHTLFHMALYDSLVEEEREILHRACFDALDAEWEKIVADGTFNTSLASKLLVHAEKCGELESAATIALAAAREFWKQYSEDEALEMASRVIAYEAEQKLARPRLTPEALALSAQIDRHRGRYERAIDRYRRAIDLFAAVGRTEEVVDATFDISAVLYRKGEFQEALNHAERALADARGSGYRKGEAAALRAIGNARLRRGDIDMAQEAFELSAAICQEIGDQNGAASSLGNIGNLQRMLGNYDAARDFYRRGLALFESLGNRALQALALNNLGSVESTLGDYESARISYERSLEIAEAIGDRAGQILALHGIGVVQNRLGDDKAAQQSYERSLSMAQAIGDRAGEATSLHSIGKLQQARGEFRGALDSLGRSLAIREAIEDRAYVARVLIDIAAVHRQLGSQDDASACLEQALAISREHGLKECENAALAELGGEEAKMRTGEDP